MQRHKAQSCKQLRNRPCHATQEEKSHLAAQSKICFSCTTKTLSFSVVLLKLLLSRKHSCVDLLCSCDSLFSSYLSSQRLCVPQCFVTAQIRTDSVWASVRISARCLVMKSNTGPFPFSPGKLLWSALTDVKYLSNEID